MWRAVWSKLILLIPEIFLVSLGSFFLVALVPGNPADHVLGVSSTPAEYRIITRQMGLDKPLLQRYLDWLGQAIHGNLGVNLVPPVEKVSTRLTQALPINLELAVLALLMALVIAIPLGILSANYPGSRLDHYVSAAAFGILSVPSFLAALLLILVFAINWHVFPVGEWVSPSSGGWGQNLYHAFLPSFTLALTQAPAFSQILRSDMISVLQEDYVLAARAKGMPTSHILLREALRPSSFSLITLAGVSIGQLISGTFIIEGIFGIQGLGFTLVNAVQQSDYPLVQGGVLVVAVSYIVLNFGVDMLYSVIDPRIRRGNR
jgi:peptide/nickel transport system permease protein